MSFDAHTRRFGTRFFHNRNAQFYSHLAELNTTKQKAFQWYRMQRACREYTPQLLYADVVKKHSNYTRKELRQSTPQTRSIAKIKHANDLKTSHSSALANNQLGRNETLVRLEDKQKHSHKAQTNTCHTPNSHIPTSNRFQILQDLNADTIGNGVFIPSMHQSVQNPHIEPTKGDATGQASKSKLPIVSPITDIK